MLHGKRDLVGAPPGVEGLTFAGRRRKGRDCRAARRRSVIPAGEGVVFARGRDAGEGRAVVKCPARFIQRAAVCVKRHAVALARVEQLHDLAACDGRFLRSFGIAADGRVGIGDAVCNFERRVLQRFQHDGAVHHAVLRGVAPGGARGVLPVRVHHIVLHGVVNRAEGPLGVQRRRFGGRGRDLRGIARVGEPARKGVVGIPNRRNVVQRRAVAERFVDRLRAAVQPAAVRDKRQLHRVAVVIQPQRQAAVCLDRAGARGRFFVQGEVLIALRRRRDLRVGRAGQAVGVREGVAAAGHVLLIVLDRVADIALRRPDRRVGDVLPRHGQRARQRGRPAQVVARPRRRGHGERLAPAERLLAHGLIAVLERDLVGVAGEIRRQHQAAVRRDRAGFDRALMRGVHMVARKGLGKLRRRAGRAVQRFGLRLLGVAAVRVLQEIACGVSGVAARDPLGIQRQAARELGVKAVRILARGVRKPAREGVALLHGRVRLGDLRAVDIRLFVDQRAVRFAEGDRVARAVVVNFEDGLAVRTDGEPDVFRLGRRLIVAQTRCVQLDDGVKRRRGDLLPGRAVIAIFDCALAVVQQVALAADALYIVLYAVGDVAAGQPLRGVARAAANRHAPVAVVVFLDAVAHVAVKLIAAAGKFRRVHRLAVAPDGHGALVRARAIHEVEGDGILFACVVNFHDGAAVRRDRLLAEALALEAGVAPRRRVGRRVGRALQILGLVQRIGAVELLLIVLHGILCVVTRDPVRIDRHALARAVVLIVGHGRRELKERAAVRLGIPAAEGIARLDGAVRHFDRRVRSQRQHSHQAAALRVERDVAHIFGVGPVDGQRALDGLGRKRQRAVFPADGHLAALRHGVRAREHRDGVRRGVVGEVIRVAEFDGIVALGRVVVVLRGIFVRIVRVAAVDLAGLHVHVVHVEQRRGQRRRAHAQNGEA